MFFFCYCCNEKKKKHEKKEKKTELVAFSLQQRREKASIHGLGDKFIAFFCLERVCVCVYVCMYMCMYIYNTH